MSQAVAAGELLEGVRVHVQGVIADSPDSLSDGTGITVDDGSGEIRVVVGPVALGGRTLTSGMTVAVAGPLGQRDSSGTGTAGYRIHATLPGELEVVVATPTPTATPPPTPTPTPGATPTPTPLPTAGPTPTPTPIASGTPRPTATPRPTVTPVPTSTPAAVPLATVRTLPIGATVRTTGVVVAEAGRLGTPALLGIASGDAGLVVHLPADSPTFARGTLLEVTGKLAAPYGQLEIRPSKGAVRSLGSGVLPTPMTIPVAGLTEMSEGRLAIDDRPAHDEAEEELGRRHDPRHRTGWRRTDQGHGRRVEPDQPCIAQGRRHISDHGLRRPARHAKRRPRRLSDLGARSRGRRRGGRRATIRVSLADLWFVRDRRDRDVDRQGPARLGPHRSRSRRS